MKSYEGDGQNDSKIRTNKNEEDNRDNRIRKQGIKRNLTKEMKENTVKKQ